MTYNAFRDDVLTHGAQFACRYADSLGVKGRTLALWLSRLAVKSQRSQVAA